MNPERQQVIREQMQALVMGSIERMQIAHPRTQQVRLGPSDLGGCRELIRAKITGDIHTNGEPMPGVKWAAFVGTAVGDFIEKAVGDHGGADTQVNLTCTLPSGIKVTGNCDILLPNRGGVADLKGKDGLDEVLREGSSLEYKIQISAYLIGAHQAGLVDDDAVGVLIYYDRSGKNKQVITDAYTIEEARGWIDVAQERLDTIADAIAKGEHAPRDWDESRCFYWGCPMYNACWRGTQPDEAITDPVLIRAIHQYDEARELKKSAEKLIGNAKQELGAWEEEPVRGTIDGFTLDWKLRAGPQGTVNRQIDLRKQRD